MFKNLRMGRRGFGHAFSCAKSSFRGMNPNPSYWIWMCCLKDDYASFNIYVQFCFTFMRPSTLHICDIKFYRFVATPAKDYVSSGFFELLFA